jgi:hypothetical protein
MTVLLREVGGGEVRATGKEQRRAKVGHGVGWCGLDLGPFGPNLGWPSMACARTQTCVFASLLTGLGLAGVAELGRRVFRDLPGSFVKVLHQATPCSECWKDAGQASLVLAPTSSFHSRTRRCSVCCSTGSRSWMALQRAMLRSW